MSDLRVNPVLRPAFHLVSPVVHCVPDASARDAYDAPPGAAPFSRFLQANRLASRGLDRFEPMTIHEAPIINDESQCSPMKAPLLPNLGEILDIQQNPGVEVVETEIRSKIVPATGRVLDLYA